MAIIDKFDDQDISEYGAAESDGSTSWTFQQSPAQDTYSIGISGVGYTQEISHSGLESYPKQGDRFEIWMRSDDISQHSQSGIFFAFEDDSNKYFARLEWQDPSPNVTVAHEIGGVTTESDTDFTSNIVDGDWIRLQVEWDDGSTFGGSAGDMQAFAYDEGGSSLGSTTVINDTTYDGTGVGEAFGIFIDCQSDGSPAYLDEALITNRVTQHSQTLSETFSGPF